MKPQISDRGLDGVTIFRDLAPAERARLASELTTLTLRRGDVLVRQGEPAEALYVVVTGRFVVTIAGRRDAISEIGPGQPIGEIAFLAGGARTATVTALRDGLVLRLGRVAATPLGNGCGCARPRRSEIVRAGAPAKKGRSHGRRLVYQLQCADCAPRRARKGQRTAM